jgi:hypothetical protein
LCRYNQHDLSASYFGAALVFHDGYHLPDVVVAVWVCCAGVVVGFAVFSIAIVAIYGVITVYFGCWVGTIMVTFLVVAGVVWATCRASISSSSSASSSSTSDSSNVFSAVFVEAAGIPCCAFIFISSLAHCVEPSMSSMCLSLRRVLVI